VRFEWDETKSLRNLHEYGVGFETAILVFDDPHTLTQRNSASEQEERWITIASVASVASFWLCIRFVKQTVMRPFALSRREQPDPMRGRLMRKLTKVQKRDIAAIAAKTNADIDFSDVAPVPDWNAAEMGKFYRPAKKPVTMRLDLDVIEWLKADGRGYQTKANWLLRSAMLHYSRNAELDSDARARKLRSGSREKKKS
jgi:uncharacterized protein (DUF4415 family)